MRKMIHLGRYTTLLAVTLLFATSCSKDEDEKLPEEQQLTQTELKTILETDEVAGVADNVISQLYMGDPSGAKTAKVNECYAAEYTETGFTVTFNNCTLNTSDNVNGTLSVVYGTEGQTAAFTASFADFYVGDIKLNGTRSFAFAGDMENNSYVFTVTSDMTVNMPDGSEISESGTKTIMFTFGDSLETTTFAISGSWTLQIDDASYMVAVNTDLEGNLACGYLTTGAMTVNKNGLEVDVDFGDGSCDDQAMVTYPNGATEMITLKD